MIKGEVVIGCLDVLRICIVYGIGGVVKGVGSLYY